jgi:hypothetical protein
MVQIGAALERPGRREMLLVGMFFVGWLVFGVLVEIKSAFLSRRYGDLGVYLRASWAIRAGLSPYDVVDSNGWHYHYPPLFALLLTPLADPPAGLFVPGQVPFALSVALYYLLSLTCLAIGVHALAASLESASRHAEVRWLPGGCRRWWLLRTVPILICLPPIGHTLMRGQANLFLLTLVCVATAAAVRGRRLWSGVWLAGAASLKIFPAYLFLYPLWRRDLRALAGGAIGLAACLAVIPAAVLGPRRTLEMYRQQAQVLILPAMGLGNDKSRAKELIEATATDSQSILTVLHNTLHPDRASRPNEVSPGVRHAHVMIGAALTLLTLLAAGRRSLQGTDVPLFVGALTLMMLLMSPVCHTHYFALALPAVMGLLARAWEADPRTIGLKPGLAALFAFVVVGNVLPLMPYGWSEFLKNAGLAMYAALALWLAACASLWRREAGIAQQQSPAPALPAAA